MGNTKPSYKCPNCGATTFNYTKYFGIDVCDTCWEKFTGLDPHDPRYQTGVKKDG